jgi:DNA-binding transcriptional regulator YiaG
MNKTRSRESFKQQMRKSMADLRSIMARGQSPSGDGRFTLRTLRIIEPGDHDARSVRRTREALNLSQALFAQLLGVSPALVRAWELGTRRPAAIARRLLDQVHDDPKRFALLVRSSGSHTPPTSRRRKAA